jgi:hypothetical protein
MKWNRLILVLLCAAMALGGTFVCKSGDDGAAFTTNPRKPATR